ncbi:MAG: Ig-like domain-containing protein [Lachnospiraceae bacterium]|nr:Ig-like domain-containing protein [Lachnospiraceae bacterium]
MKRLLKKSVVLLASAMMLLSSGVTVGAVEKVLITKIELNHEEVTIAVGEDVELIETIYPDDASRVDVEWDTSDATIADVDGWGTVDGISPGTATITCKAMDGSGVTATCEVTVTEGSTDYVKMITLNYTDIFLCTNETKQLTADVYPKEALNKNVVWKSLDKSVVTVDDNGMVQAVAPGTALVTCTAADGQGAKTSCIVTVVNPDEFIRVTEITVNPKTLSLQVGDVEAVSASVLPTNVSNKIVEWNSTDNNVVTIDNNGTVIAVGVGSASLICTATDGSGVTDKCDVTVSKTLVAKIILSKISTTMYIGDKDTLTCEIIPSNAENMDVEWESSNKNVATVDQQGNIEAVGLGTANITCTAKDEGAAYETCVVKVIKEEEPQWPFNDVEVIEGNWKYEAIKYVYERGLMTGVKENEFGPQETITRGMVATILYRMAGSPSITYNNEFSDVSATKYYARPIAWVCQNNIATGYDGGVFKPEKAITRAELAKMLCQYAKLAGYDTSGTVDISTYEDASMVPGYAVKYMRWAVANEIISGSKKQNKMYLNPNSNATRAETAAMIQRLLTKFE